jgi:phosphoglycerate dehydrogenase-like enzyme
MTSHRRTKVVLTWRPFGFESLVQDFPEVDLVLATEREDALAELADADAAFAAGFDAELLAAGPGLRWVHAASGGVEAYLFPEMVESPVVLTCMKGAFDIPGAEHALAVMLAFARRLDYDLRQRPSREFEYTDPNELCGKTLGIVGLGGMGRELAKRASCLGMQVLGLARTPRPAPEGVDRVLQPGQLAALLTESDYVAVALPVTAVTRGVIGEAELRAMRPTAYLIDVSGRDALYDQEAVARALREGWIAGANLQIAPPPPDSPLWELDNFLYSFHRATSPECEQRGLAIFRANLSRFMEQRPLLSVVDKRLGY